MRRLEAIGSGLIGTQDLSKVLDVSVSKILDALSKDSAPDPLEKVGRGVYYDYKEVMSYLVPLVEIEIKKKAIDSKIDLLREKRARIVQGILDDDDDEEDEEAEEAEEATQEPDQPQEAQEEPSEESA